MMRNTLLGIVLLAFASALAGCGKEEGRADKNAPIYVSPEVNPKTGKASKSLEAGIK
jgi:predicted small lipoprotein YifL